MRQMMRWFGVGVLSIALCGATVEAASKTHRSAKGYSIVPPAGWKAGPSNFMGTDAIWMSPTTGKSPFTANLVAMVAPAVKGETFEKGVKNANAMMGRMLNKFKVVKQGETKLAGQRAWLMIGTHEMGSPPQKLRFYAVTAPYKNRVYSFNGTATDAQFARYQPLFQKAIASVRWTK